MKHRNTVGYKEYKEARNLALTGMGIFLDAMAEDDTDMKFNAMIMNHIVMVVSKIQEELFGIKGDAELDEFFTDSDEWADEEDSCECEEESCECEERAASDIDEKLVHEDGAASDEEPNFIIDGNDYIILEEHGYECDEDFSQYDEDDGLDDIEDDTEYDEWDELADGFAPDFDEPFEVIFEDEDDGEDVQDKIA